MGGMAGSVQGLSGVLGPALPRRKTLIILIIGFLLGLGWGYLVHPVVYYDADPINLQQGFQDEWVKLLADRNAAANADIGDSITQSLTYIDDPLGVVDRLINDPNEAVNRTKLEAIRPYAEAAQPVALEAPTPNMVDNILPWVIGPIALLVVAVILGTLWNLLIYPFLEPTFRRAGLGKGRGAGTVTDERAKAEIQAIRDAKAAQKTQASDFGTSGYGPPLLQKMSIYGLGRGQYDDSFAIEDADSKFLGECGAGISETIGVGDPAKVTAVEVWLFDKDDFVRTVTKIFATPHAFSDPGLRAKLDPKGDVILVEPGAVATLETSSLRLQARVVDVQYGSGPLPPNSYFERMTIELAAWRKEPSAAPATGTVPAAASTGAYVPPTPNYSTPAPAAPTMPTTPPPSPSVQASPFAPPVSRPAAPPPYSPPAPQSVPTQQPARPPVDDDDPFGGTGDFTPVS